jgi:hypothetical protein
MAITENIFSLLVIFVYMNMLTTFFLTPFPHTTVYTGFRGEIYGLLFRE